MQISDCVLIVIDVQGKLAGLVHEHQAVLANIERSIKLAKILNIPILWTEQAPDKIGKTIEPIASFLSDSLKPIHKSTFSCYGDPQFKSQIDLWGRKQVLLVGIEAHVCVYQTARDLKRAGYDVYFCADAVSSRTKHNLDIALGRMQSEGILMTSVEMVTCDLLYTSTHRHFKEVMATITR